MADDLLAAYPKTVKLKDGTTVNLRVLIPQDRAEVGQFFERVPSEDRAFLKDEMMNREEIEIWLDLLDPERETSLVAVLGNRIIGTAVLERRRSGWARHVGEIRIVADPAFRGRGIGHLLAQSIFQLAVKLGLEKVVAEMMADRPEPIRVFERLGFEAEATLKGQVKDRRGRRHDLLVMAYNV